MTSVPFVPPTNPSVEDCWRGVVLYGKNTASYKFALATALLELRPESGQLLKLEDLAPVFAGHIARHLVESPKQITASNGRFLRACLEFNEGQDLSKLVDATVADGFNNVIDAFHMVSSAPVAHRFYVDERKENRGIRITDEFSKLMDGIYVDNLGQEVGARWRLVETAWNLGLSANLLTVQHDIDLQEMFVHDRNLKRRSVTSSRAALSGYQKGKCFYCATPLSLVAGSTNTDVDHFFPHALKQRRLGINFDGVWNLVLSCALCNRGKDGKFDRIPSTKLLGRLFGRNEHFIGSHHPLRETLINQTGSTVTVRQAFLADVYQKVQLNPAQAWEPPDEND